ncbi:MAG TPA: hypothetical protein VFN10_04600 [Thermoanaerobaculia bacterium]|nr:hypothetical protein [Thermoanaerobaculia bacterium]
MHFRSAFLAALAALIVPLSAHAVNVTDVRRALSGLRGETPVSIAVNSVDQRSDGKQNGESRGSSILEDDGTNIRLVYAKKALAPKDQKKRGADHSIAPADAAELLNYAPSLLKLMEGATIKRTAITAWNGRSATVIEIEPVREKDPDGDKWVKAYEDALTLWVGADGVPLAAHHNLHIKARIVVVGFELKQDDDLQFERVNDRLVVTKRTTTSSGSGLGQSENGTKTITATIAPAVTR